MNEHFKMRVRDWKGKLIPLTRVEGGSMGIPRENPRSLFGFSRKGRWRPLQ